MTKTKTYEFFERGHFHFLGLLCLLQPELLLLLLLVQL
jgi:hypothetical protein